MTDAASPLISDAALNLIVTEEDGSPAYYTAHYTHFEWPGGVSGPTIGVGYDCGYSTAARAQADWQDFVDAATLAVIAEACSRTGANAAAWVSENRWRVTIPFTVGLAQFKAKEIPQWDAKVRAALPNYDALPLDCKGALLSLAYNRGPSFDAPGARYTEMRNIRAHMEAKQYALIPTEFLAMRRLWPPEGSDLWNRREHEAALFEKGLTP